jgi:hypothetical protein
MAELASTGGYPLLERSLRLACPHQATSFGERHRSNHVLDSASRKQVTPSVCGNIISVGELNEGSIPPFDLDVGFPKGMGNDLCRLLCIEGRSRIPIRNQLWIVTSTAGACREETASSQDPLRLGDGNLWFIEVVEHPEHRHSPDASINQRESGCIPSDSRPIWAIGNLARGGINADPIQTTA